MSMKLDAVNEMLASIGEAPTSSTDSTDPLVVSAVNKLERVDKKIQARRWWFNTEVITLSPTTTDSEIILPSNTLSADPTLRTSPYTKRGTRLYDPVNNTFTIEESVELELVLQLDFEWLPMTAANYITATAVKEFFADEDGDLSKVRELSERLSDTWGYFHAENLRNQDVNAIDSDLGYALLSETDGFYINRS